MPIGWMTALKMVPWGDVIENAPTLVNGAKKLFTRTRADVPPVTPTPATDVSAAATAAKPVDVEQRILQLNAALEQALARTTTLEAESRDTAVLITSLAEQQEKVITAISVLEKRTNVLIATTIVLTLTCIALVTALLTR